MPEASMKMVPGAPGPAATAGTGPQALRHLSVLDSQLQLINANIYAALLGSGLTGCLLAWLVWLVNPDPLSGSWIEQGQRFLAWLAAGNYSASAAGFEGVAVLRLHSASWLLAYLLVSLACALIWRYFWRRTGSIYTVEQTYRLLQALALAVGLCWGIGCGWLYQPESSAVTLGMVSLMGGLSGGLLSGVGVRARLYWLVSLPMAVGLVGALLYHGGEVNPVLPVALLLLLLSNGVFAHNTERHIGSTIELRFKNMFLVEQLREQTRVAEQANLAKSNFLAGASHDLRQPVHALNLFLESLSTTRLDARQETIVTHARAASLASREMLDTLLDFSRIEAGVMEPKPRTMPLAGLLRQLEDEYGPQADSKGLVYRSRDCIDHVYCDPSLLSLILRNLVGNAIRYTVRGGVLVAVRTRGADKLIEVWDTGIGIDASHHEKIFHEFHQISNQERDHHKGLGLGLAIVRRLVDSLGLELSLASRLGKGSVFSLRLPCASPPCQPAGVNALVSPTFQPGAARHEASSLMGLRVLVVDDEVLVREGMRMLLGQWGCFVEVFRTVEGATRYIGDFDGDGPPFDLLITDFRLENGVTGHDVIRAVRAALQKLPDFADFDPPVVIVTGDTDPLRISQARGLGATVLHKPIDTQVLHAELAKAFAFKTGKNLLLI
ncbi:MAG: hybrid sensor histidine kinase/response regulator [Xanthomonadaceae bacterium]|nr:hybrid sensor histidine kinase/response regulator [Xanthomonadaceae bacterium]